MSVCVGTYGIFKSHRIRSIFDVELHNVTERDLRLSILENHPNGQQTLYQNPLSVGQNLYRGYMYGQIQTKFGINLQNNTGEVSVE
jgi:hypothetical protein